MDPYRDPPELSRDLFPGLSVWESRVTGSITINDSRLPLWAFIPTVLHQGWPAADDWIREGDYPEAKDQIIDFLYCLLEMRGEFGRLLLMLANAERVEGQRSDEHFALQTPATPGGGIYNMSLEEGDGKTPWPESWWEMPDLVEPIRQQLQRCLDALNATS